MQTDDQTRKKEVSLNEEKMNGEQRSKGRPCEDELSSTQTNTGLRTINVQWNEDTRTKSQNDDASIVEQLLEELICTVSSQKSIDNQKQDDNQKTVDANEEASQKTDDKLSFSKSDHVNNRVVSSDTDDGSIRIVNEQKRPVDRKNVKSGSIVRDEEDNSTSRKESFSDVEIVGEKNSNGEFMIDKTGDRNFNAASKDDPKKESRSEFVLKLKGLPYKATTHDIKNFFKGYRYKKGQIHIQKIDGRSTGVAFVEFDSLVDMNKAFDLDWKRMNPTDRRYVEISKASADELRSCLEDNNVEISEFVKIKGIPYACTKSQIQEFFKPLKIAKDGIIIQISNKHRMNKDCYVQFETIEDARKALLKNNEPLGSRYVKVYQSSKSQFKEQANAVLENSLSLENCMPSLSRKKKSVHKVGLYNRQSSTDSKSPQDDQTHVPISTVFPYYFEETENKRRLDSRSDDIRNVPKSLRNRISSSSSIHTHSPIRSTHRSSNDKSFFHKRSFDRRSTERRSSDSRPLEREENERRSSLHRKSTDNAFSSMRSNSHRSPSPKRTKGASGFYFKSFYNENDEKSKDNYLQTVTVKNLPKNCTTEELFELFDQIDVVPKRVKFHVDRGRKTTEAEVLFRTLEDTKKSFLLSGARLESERGSRNIEIHIKPQLWSVNVINPSTNHRNPVKRAHDSSHRSKPALYEQNRSTKSHYHKRSRNESSLYDREHESTPSAYSISDRSSFDAYERSRSHNYTNSELIDQLKSSIQADMRNYLKNDSAYPRRYIDIN